MGGSTPGVFLFNPGYAFIRFSTWRPKRVLFACRHFRKEGNKKREKRNEKQENNIAANHVHAAVADVKITCAFVACKTYFSAPILLVDMDARADSSSAHKLERRRNNKMPTRHDTWVNALVFGNRVARTQCTHVYLFNFIYFELNLLKSRWIFNRWRRWWPLRRLCSERRARNVYEWCEAFDTSAMSSRSTLIQDFNAVEVFAALDLHFLELIEFIVLFIHRVYAIIELPYILQHGQLHHYSRYLPMCREWGWQLCCSGKTAP